MTERQGGPLNAAGSYLAVKAAVPAAVIFLVCLILLGIMGMSAQDAAAGGPGCGSIGNPSVEDPEPGGEGNSREYENIREEQTANAKIIDSVAVELEMPGRATHVALVTALQESNLINIDYGDRDSVGVFQQRPSQGWGTVSQIMKPEYSAKMFFQGGEGGDPPGLEDINGWEDMPLGAAAQAVQKSGFPDAYDPHERRAKQIADRAGIDLQRAGSEKSNEEEPPGESAEDCYPDNGKGKGGGGNPFYDGDSEWPKSVRNPSTTEQAVAAARAEAKSGSNEWFRRCLAFVAEMYGWNYSGVVYAIDHYREMPKQMRNDGDRNPPPGALMYWTTGQRAGHVAIYLGDGKIASNDIKRPGYIDIVDATAPEKEWIATYVGWAPPHFPRGG